jgi:ribosomal protein S6--L-glutamate ligase
MNFSESLKDDKRKVLILGSKNYGNRRILRECINLGMKAQIVEPENFILSISNINGNDKIYYKGKRIFKNSIDFVIARIGNEFETGVKVLEHLTKNLGIPASASAEGLLQASDKFLCSQVLSAKRISTPKSVHFKKAENYQLLKKLVGGYPFVAKLLYGSQGKGVFLINDDLSGSTALSTISNIKKVVLQQYIETAKKDENKNDIRAFVVGGKVVAAMKRYSIKNDFRSNYSISKQAVKVTLSDEQKKLAIQAAESLNLNICGVDIVTDVTTKKDYVIECNGNPGTGISDVTKINVFKEMALLAKDWNNDQNGKLSFMPWSSDPANILAKRREVYNEYNVEPESQEMIFDIDDQDTGIGENEQVVTTQEENEYSIIFDDHQSFSKNLYESEIQLLKVKQGIETLSLTILSYSGTK